MDFKELTDRLHAVMDDFGVSRKHDLRFLSQIAWVLGVEVDFQLTDRVVENDAFTVAVSDRPSAMPGAWRDLARSEPTPLGQNVEITGPGKVSGIVMVDPASDRVIRYSETMNGTFYVRDDDHCTVIPGTDWKQT